MAHWKTDDISADLIRIPGVKSVTENGQGGDYDTNNLIIDLKGTSDQLRVCGFDDESGELVTIDDADVPMVELTDGLSSNGGLNSRNLKTAKVYILIRQYFIDKGFEVVPTMNAYF